MAPRGKKSRRSRKSRKTEECLAPNTVKVEDSTLNWLATVEDYVTQTTTNILDVSDRGLGKEEVRYILNFLLNSQVIELNLKSNSLTDGITDLAPLLVKTKIEKLDVSYCGLTKTDVLKLTEILKDTQINELIVLGYGWAEHDKFESNEAHEFISHLQNSKLTTLLVDFLFNLFPLNEVSFLAQEFLKTSITCFDLPGLSSNDLILLPSKLIHSSVTSLNLSCTDEMSTVLTDLSRKIIDTNIEKLNLCRTGMSNGALEILGNGLIGSKVNDLSLEENRFSDLRRLFTKINRTQILTLNFSANRQLRNDKIIDSDSFKCSRLTSLNLSHCNLSDKQGEGLIESLRNSNVTKLDVSHNRFGSLTVKKFAENINDVNLVDLDISYNNFPPNGLSILGQCLRSSKLVHINVSRIDGVNGELSRNNATSSSDLLSFLKETEGSFISQIEMNYYCNAWDHYDGVYSNAESSWKNILVNTTFTELHLSDSEIKSGFSRLVNFLTFTQVTHLNLSQNRIEDYGAKLLAELLKETQIRRLNLNNNCIGNEGAKALALSLKETNLLYLHLNWNNIGDYGLEYLAENAEDTFISVLDVRNNPGTKTFLVDKVLWKNKVPVDKLYIFKQIAPLGTSNNFNFYQNSDNFDVSTFLEKCMCFYRCFIDKPRAINVLLEEEKVSLSKDQLYKLVFEEFPRQFSEFVAYNFETDLTYLVDILKRADEMDLTAIVNALLLHRPVYRLDIEQEILHPHVYTLLLKYRHPICNLDVEPQGVKKIINYFAERTDIKGAQELIGLLRESQSSRTV